MRIDVHKSRLVLELWDGARLLAAYPIGVGRNPGHKEREGDERTPEGRYFVCVKNPASQFHLSLGLSYPNSRDALRGFCRGRLSLRQLLAILSAQIQGRRPPWKTPLGGEIFLHGSPGDPESTRGCVSMRNADIEALFHSVAIGTRVTIRR